MKPTQNMLRLRKIVKNHCRASNDPSFVRALNVDQEFIISFFNLSKNSDINDRKGQFDYNISIP